MVDEAHEGHGRVDILVNNAGIKRLIEPEEVASMVDRLCSDKARSVSSAVWTINLGWTVH